MAGFYLSVSFLSCSSDGVSIPDTASDNKYENMTNEEIIRTLSDSFQLNGLEMPTEEEYNSYPRLTEEELREISENSLETRSSYKKLITVPVGNQGQEGSCVAFAAGYLGSTYMIKANKNYSAEARSPEFLYNSTKIHGNCTSGTYIDWFSPLRFGQNYKWLLKLWHKYYLCDGKDDQWRPLYQWLL